MKRRKIVPVSLRVFSYAQSAKSLRQLLCCGVLGLGLSGATQAQTEVLVDRLQLPSSLSAKAAESALNSLASAGPRVIVTGERGHILWSEHGDGAWHQAQVPVSSDLTAVQFVDDRQGWAVGHDGVILNSRDGGESWVLQLDGHRIALLLQALADDLDPRQQKSTVGNLEYAAEQGVDQSLLGLHFSDARNGIVIGANNLVLQTHDGGESWQVISNKVDNPRSLHLYGIQEAFGSLFIVGEQGLILRRAPDSDFFEPISSPYQGSWFGALGGADSLLVYGLLGNAWVSRDAGLTWQQSKLDSAVAITAAEAISESDIVMVNLSGDVFYSNDGGENFKHREIDQRYPFFAVAQAPDSGLVVAGIHGVHVLTGKSGDRP